MINRFALIVLVIPSLLAVPAQENTTIVEFDQHYTLLSTGNLIAVWDITITPEEGLKSMVLHAFFSKKAYIKNVVVSDAEGSLNSKMLSREGVPLLEITFRDRLPPGQQYHFTCNLEVWKAVDIGETEGSFTMLTGYNFPVEKLKVTAALPGGTKLRSFFPADGKVSSGEVTSISWTMSSLPSGYNIQISIAFDILSESFADNLFQDGLNLYNLKDFENASSKFEQARDIYSELNLQEKVSQCDTYLGYIEGMKAGLPLFEEGVTLYQEGKYAEAAAKFQEVKSIFEQYGIVTDEVDTYIEKSTTYLDAFSELQKGDTLLQEGKKTEARAHFVKARELFSGLGDSVMVEQVNTKIEETAEKEVVQEEKGRSFTGLVVVVIAIAGIVGLVLVRVRKPAVLLTEEQVQEEMRQLKARFVYGEINKKQYEERLAELEKMLEERKKKE